MFVCELEFRKYAFRSYRGIAVVLFVFLVSATNVNANYWEKSSYRAKIISIKEMAPRPNEDQPNYETRLELMTEPKDKNHCNFAKGTKVTAQLGIWQNQDVPYLKPGMEIEVECEYQNYKTPEGEAKETTFWSIWDSAPSIRYKNESSLTVRRNLNHGLMSDHEPPHTCSGSLKEKVALEKVGLSVKLLAQGVECVATDFDGNGYSDFALFPPSPQDAWFRKALVIFFEGKKIKLVSELSDAPTQLCRGPYGCACVGIAENDGLQQNGGGESDRSAVFIPATGTWKQSTCGGEGAEE